MKIIIIQLICVGALELSLPDFKAHEPQINY